MSGTSMYFPGKWKSQTFTSNGTFTVPDEVEAVFIEMYGGGAGGPCPGAVVNNGDPVPALRGGLGAKPVTTFVGVTPGASITVTIGLGGTGGTASLSQQPGAAGGTTSFGSVEARGGGTSGTLFPSYSNENGPRGYGGANTSTAGGGEGAYGNGGDAPSGNGGIGAGGAAGVGSGFNNIAGTAGGNGGNGICIVWWKVD